MKTSSNTTIGTCLVRQSRQSPSLLLLQAAVLLSIITLSTAMNWNLPKLPDPIKNLPGDLEDLRDRFLTPLPANASPWRATWISIDTMRERPIFETMKMLQKIGINTVYVNVWCQGRIMYHSLRYAQLTGFRAHDVLTPALAAGRALGMRVFAWFEYGFAVHHTSLGVKPSRFAQMAVSSNWTIGRSNGFFMMDPNQPRIVEMMKDFMVECVQMYKSRGLAAHKGDSDPKHVLYCAAMHRDLPGASEETITNAMERISTALRQVGVPMISLSPNNAYWAKRWYCQDWLLWLERGYIDDVFVQMYFPVMKDFDFNVKKTLREIPRRFHPHIGFGLGVVIDKTLVGTAVVQAWLDRLFKENYLKGIALWHSRIILQSDYRPVVLSMFAQQQQQLRLLASSV